MARKPDKRIGGFINGVYFVEAMIGWGGSSKVYRVRHTDTLKYMAMKVVSKPKSQIGCGAKASRSRSQRLRLVISFLAESCSGPFQNAPYWRFWITQTS